ncbi:MAG: RnfH family protein [Burkholderiales bacterium]|nr:RnfH family protein [Burkholderiales bacterium]
MRVSLAVALPARQEVIELELPEDATVADAIAAARLGERFPGVDFAAMRTGIWSRPASVTARLRDGDRVELYRALKADPKDMRRKRAKLRTSSRPRSGP